MDPESNLSPTVARSRKRQAIAGDRAGGGVGRRTCWWKTIGQYIPGWCVKCILWVGQGFCWWRSGWIDGVHRHHILCLSQLFSIRLFALALSALGARDPIIGRGRWDDVGAPDVSSSKNPGKMNIEPENNEVCRGKQPERGCHEGPRFHVSFQECKLLV